MHVIPPLAALAGLVAAANAVAHNQHGQFHNKVYRRSNDSLTTATVYDTKTMTFTHCPATVTDCAAESGGSEVFVTTTVDIYTTVCPVTAVASASSAIRSSIASASRIASLGSATPDVPLNTAVSPSPVEAAGVVTGTSTTVVTTTIHSTSTKYLTETVYATRSKSSVAASPTPATNAAPSGSAGASAPDTNTVHWTSTHTNYITVSPGAANDGIRVRQRRPHQRPERLVRPQLHHRSPRRST
ncbi:lustrin a-like protein [Teratosphaeria destructans]|uniref:Lustrin a-like protein n=1 Tax=Teratosphaeria destructans TaxID=418781 RepID=A0A9W7VZ50_9PEZI|nr:lustrin a-like protein [Teratosphaeria destructans]